MKFPSMPRKGVAVEETVRDIIHWLRSSRIVNVAGGRIKETPNGSTIEITTPTKTQPKEKQSHPWKVTANGDNTVHVGEGRIHSFLDGASGLASISMAGFGDWDGGDVTVTAATGVIYGSIQATDSVYPLIPELLNGGTLVLLRKIPDLDYSVTVNFAAAIPRDTGANFFYWEIAQVTLASGVASVTKQVLRHDPMLWSVSSYA